jgi:hypothetical protein
VLDLPVRAVAMASLAGWLVEQAKFLTGATPHPTPQSCGY